MLGGGIRYNEIQAQSTFRTDGRQLSAVTHVDMDVHLIHDPGDDPKNILARKATIDDMVTGITRRLEEELMHDLQ